MVMKQKNLSKKSAQKISGEKKPASSSDGMMFEVLNDKMDLMLEGQDATHSRIDQLSGRVGGIEDKVLVLEVMATITEEHLVGLKGRIIELNGKFDGLDKKIGGLGGKFDDLAKDVRKKADKEETVALNRRITNLETI